MLYFVRDKDGNIVPKEGVPPEDWDPTSNVPLFPREGDDDIDVDYLFKKIGKKILSGEVEESRVFLNTPLKPSQRDELRTKLYEHFGKKYILRSRKIQEEDWEEYDIEPNGDRFEVFVNLRSRSNWDNRFEKGDNSDPDDSEDESIEKEFEKLFDEE